MREISWWSKKMMKAGGIGRLGNVTKLLQRQRRDSQWSRILSMGRRSGGITLGKFLKSAASQSPSKNRRAAAVEKKCDASTSQSNNFGVTVSRKRFKPSTPGSSMHLNQTTKWPIRNLDET